MMKKSHAQFFESPFKKEIVMLTGLQAEKPAILLKISFSFNNVKRN
jgi:hypothetical protein